VSRPVVSAEDVRAAARKGELRLAVPADAIVTPLARDEAARRGIELVEAGGPPPVRAHQPATHAATCDPDDVERIVERVRARMPVADASLVRDIARRLLERLGG
jgi:catechol 2,3-dioxygenase-like lactoylglutathione lyase family enzyme